MLSVKEKFSEFGGYGLNVKLRDYQEQVKLISKQYSLHSLVCSDLDLTIR